MRIVESVFNDIQFDEEIAMVPSNSETQFEEKYISLRKKEGRWYSEKELGTLPKVNKDHLHYGEWKIRKHSADAFISSIKSDVNADSIILEVGCGNGWLSNYISKGVKCNVLGIDINLTELKLANTHFTSDKAQFVFAELFSPEFKKKSLDLIVFAASVQYFKDFNLLINRAKEILKDNGQIHIFNSPFYQNQHQADLAFQRSLDYYGAMGYPEMCKHYFHRTRMELLVFNFKIKLSGRSINDKIKRKLGFPISSFPWIIIE